MRTDAIDVNSLVAYINDTKPFHSKLTEVTIEYQANDDVFVSIEESKHTMDIHLSSVWEIHRVSDGVRTQYKIPATVFPRHSKDIHQCLRVGVTDEIPGSPGAYRIPFNNGLKVTVNGVQQNENEHYTVDPIERNVVQFVPSAHPVLGTNICIDVFVVDRIFIALDGVWQPYQLIPTVYGNGYSIMGYDTSVFDTNPIPDYIGTITNRLDNSGLDEVTFDTIASDTLDSSNDRILVDSDQDKVLLYPIGSVKKLLDASGQDYYVFEFNDPLPLNTNVWLRVEQRETYNGWTQTRIAEQIKFLDYFYFDEALGVQIADPSSWDWWMANPDFAVDRVIYESDFGLQPTDYITNIQGLRSLLDPSSPVQAAEVGMTVQQAFIYKQENPGEFDDIPLDTVGFDSAPLGQGNILMLTKQDLLKMYGAYFVIIRAPGTPPGKANIQTGNYTNLYWFDGYSVNYAATGMPPLRDSVIKKKMTTPIGVQLDSQVPRGAILAKQTTWTFDEFKIDISDKRFGLLDEEGFDSNVFDSINGLEQMGYYKLFTIKSKYSDTTNPHFTDAYNINQTLIPDVPEQVRSFILERLLIRASLEKSDRLTVDVNEITDYPSLPESAGLYPPIFQISKVAKPDQSDETSSTAFVEGLNIQVRALDGTNLFQYTL